MPKTDDEIKKETDKNIPTIEAKTDLTEAAKELETTTQKKKEAVELSKTIDAFLLGQKNADKLTKAQITVCKQTALLFNLNPLKREIHFIPHAIKEKVNGYWQETGKFEVAIVIGYDVYIKRAEDTGLLNGWGVEFENLPDTFEVWVGYGEKAKKVVVKDIKAKITINRKGWDEPFVHEVYLSEARQDTPIWTKMPRFMLRKTAIGQGFRLCFPKDLGGLPYTPEELGVGVLEGGEMHADAALPANASPAQPEPKKAPPASPPADAAMLTSLLGMLIRKGKTQEPILTKLKIKAMKELSEKQATSIMAQLSKLPDAPKVAGTMPVQEAADAIFDAPAPQTADIDLDEVDAGIERQRLEEQQGGAK